MQKYEAQEADEQTEIKMNARCYYVKMMLDYRTTYRTMKYSYASRDVLHCTQTVRMS